MTKKSSPKIQKEQTSYVTPVNMVLLAVVLGLGIYIYTLYKPSSILDKNSNSLTDKNTVPATPTVSPTPYPLTPQGKFDYTFSWGSGTTFPKMNKLSVDPHDPKVGEKQTVRAFFSHSTPITGMNMVLTLDSQKPSEALPMTLVEGTSTDGVWEGTWTISESHDYTYILTPMVTADGKQTPYKTGIKNLYNL